MDVSVWTVMLVAVTLVDVNDVMDADAVVKVVMDAMGTHSRPVMCLHQDVQAPAAPGERRRRQQRHRQQHLVLAPLY